MSQQPRQVLRRELPGHTNILHRIGANRGKCRPDDHKIDGLRARLDECPHLFEQVQSFYVRQRPDQTEFFARQRLLGVRLISHHR